MSSGGIVDFLVEVPEFEAISVLRTAATQKSVFVFKLVEAPTLYQTKIESFIDKRVILDKDVAHMQFDLDQDVSIKFNVGTEIYFVKTKLKRYLNRIYFDKASKLMQLRRRREARYIVPKKWNQSASIKGVNCRVQDISLSGIRFQFTTQTPVLKNDEIVKIQFQIYKRAVIFSEATVRFLLSQTNQGDFAGMEFKNITDLQKERIQSIVDDIINYQANAKF